MNLSNQLLLTAIFSFHCLVCISQSEQWVNCISHRQVNNLIEHDNLTYIATTGGLIVYNALSESTINLNRATSDIPSNNIIDIEIDMDSTLWLMTDIGLCSFKDGNWTEYLDLFGLITLDEKGQINVVSKSGLYYWNENNFSSISTFPDLTNFELYDVVIDEINGDIWLSVGAAFIPSQIFKYSNSTWTNGDFSTQTYELFELAFDSENQLWCISDRNLYKYDEEEWVTKSELIEHQDNYYFTSLGSDDAGNIFISYSHRNELSDNYIYKIDPEEQTNRFSIPRENSRIRFTPTFIKTSKDNSTIYLGTINHGCMTYEEESWSKLPIETSPFKTNFMQLFKTEHKGIYIKSTPNSYYGNYQLLQYEENKWFDLSNEYPFENAFNFRVSFSNGEGQELWMNFNDSLYINEQGSWTYVSFPNIEPDITESNSQIYFDHEDRKWLLNKEKKIILYESASGWKVFDEDETGISSVNYQSIFNHPETDELWISGFKGVSIYNYTSEDWRFLSFNELGLSQSYLSMYIDPDENIIAANGRSLLSINEETGIDTIATLSGYPELENFFTTFVDQDTIWLGMKGGVAKYYDNTFEILGRHNSGIVNGYINTIVRDDNGNLWFSGTSGGLAIYNENGLSEDFLDKDFLNNINIEDNLLSFDLFPNPFNSTLNLKCPNDITSGQLNVYNQFGQVIYSKSHNTQNEVLPLVNIQAGLYFVEIIDLKSKKRNIKKCIKI
jgi:hypothetical protein